TCISIVFISEGRVVDGIIGRNVSLSWTLKDTKRDSLSISRNSTFLLTLWPYKTLVIWHHKNDRFHIDMVIDANDTLAVTVCISRLTEQDAGIYKLIRRLDSEEGNGSVTLQIHNVTALPRITMVQHDSMDSSIQLQCTFLQMFTGKVSWKLNESIIESQDRYYQNNSLLSIKNLTADDKYSIYTCNENGSGFDSDPYLLNISGPNVVKFESNVTVAKEHEGLNLFCDADCYPTCTWNWTKLDILSTSKKVISANKELKINNVTRKDAGKYSCKVYNTITSTSLEGSTYLEVVYGPGEIYTNISNNVIQVDKYDTISVSCYADCFPPCQIGWMETKTNIPNREAVLQLERMTVDGNYTCYATNPMNPNASNSRTIYIKVTSGQSELMTTTLTAVSNTDLLLIRHLLYVVIGLGCFFAIGFLACLLHKFRACSRVRGSSINNRSSEHSAGYRDSETPPMEHLAGNYWTIVSNTRGDLTTAVDVDNAQCITQTAHSIKNVLKEKNLAYSISANFDIELEEYSEPVHAGTVDDYIHPVHKGYVEC
ncbi:hypothetical protein ACJMK2_025664, partial [Sinanodonta woodiana]